MSESVVLGERYRDPISGWEGVATCLHTYLHGCRRVTLAGTDGDGRPDEYAFDEPQLEPVNHAATGFLGGLTE